VASVTLAIVAINGPAAFAIFIKEGGGGVVVAVSARSLVYLPALSVLVLVVVHVSHGFNSFLNPDKRLNLSGCGV